MRTACPRVASGYFAAWRADRTLDAVHDALRGQVRALDR
jgi:hypothetical protein